MSKGCVCLKRVEGGDDIGMTDRQFIAFRRLELEDFQEMLEIAKRTQADPELLKKIEKAIENAKADIEA
jgi:hypothetical protein